MGETVNGHAMTAAPTVEERFGLASETRVDGAWLIASGELDIASATSLDDALRASVKGRPLFLDLREVSFCDSTGLALLLRARRSRQPLTILAGPAVARVADIAGVSELLLES